MSYVCRMSTAAVRTSGLRVAATHPTTAPAPPPPVLWVLLARKAGRRKPVSPHLCSDPQSSIGVSAGDSTHPAPRCRETPSPTSLHPAASSPHPTRHACMRMHASNPTRTIRGCVDAWMRGCMDAWMRAWCGAPHAPPHRHLPNAGHRCHSVRPSVRPSIRIHRLSPRRRLLLVCQIKPHLHQTALPAGKYGAPPYGPPPPAG
jgi:hypothetical protein